MNEDIDEILANILAKEPLTDEEKQHLQMRKRKNSFKH